MAYLCYVDNVVLYVVVSVFVVVLFVYFHCSTLHFVFACCPRFHMPVFNVHLFITIMMMVLSFLLY